MAEGALAGRGELPTWMAHPPLGSLFRLLQLLASDASCGKSRASAILPFLPGFFAVTFAGERT